MILERLVSGGQTGADRAALDWGLSNGVSIGGWCPKGRRAEDGQVDESYGLQETPDDRYSVRTLWNVRDADATLLISVRRKLSGGSALTVDFAKRLRKPWLHISRERSKDPGGELARFVDKHFIRTLNVAGPRASSEPEVAEFVAEVLDAAFG